MTTTRQQKTLHDLFLVSIWIKGGAGVLEIIAGFLCIFITPEMLKSLVVSLTAPELDAGPHGWIAASLSRSVQHLSADTAMFAAAYLIIHGLIKIFLVAGLLLGRLWSYPLSLGFLAAFIVYQGYRYTHTHAISLILLTVFDLAVAFLIWREYQSRRQDSGW